MQSNPTFIHPSFKLIECSNGVRVINPEHPINLDQSTANYTILEMQRLPYNIYFINTESYIVNINEFTVISNGFYSAEDAIGRTVSDITSKEHALRLLSNDKTILNDNKMKLIDETFNRNDGLLVNAFSIKMPWYDNNHKILGIFGYSILGNTGPKYAAYIAKSLGLNNIAIKLEKLTLTIVEAKIDHIQLTARQTECIYFLIRGKSTKEIGKILNLSSRTIETYLDNIKHKLKCQNTAELIEKAIDSGFSNVKLVSHSYTFL